MAILEKIRNRSLILILVIGMALFAFVISDLFRNQGFGTSKSVIAEINGTDLKIDDFRQRVESLSRAYGPNTSTIQVVNQVWNQELRKTLLSEEYEKLGLGVERDQIISVVKANPSFASNPTFQNEAGLFDEGKFIEFIADLKDNDPLRYEQWKQQETALIEGAREQMYFNLIKGGMFSTLQEGAQYYRFQSDKIDIKYVRVPYTSIPDSAVTVTKKEIQSYINSHKSDFEEEASRDIRYVLFEEKPSLEDEEEVKNRITALLDDSVEYNSTTGKNDTIPGFRKTTNLEDFVNRHSDVRYDSSYIAKKELPAMFADTLFNLAVNQVYGPYKDGNNYKISRMVAKQPEGSVKASHILVAYEGAARANPDIKRTKEEAESRAQELLAQAKANPDAFTELARDNSDGPSAPQGGDLGYFEQGDMVSSFNDFCFNNGVGAIGLVETDFGYHVIRVDDKRDIVFIATVSQKLEPSEKTSNELFTNTTKFEMAVTEGDYEAIAKESSYAIRPVNKIKAMDESLPGLGNQRAVVQWAFEEDRKVGDVSRFTLPNGYAVVQVTAKTKKGVMSPEEASTRVIPILRKQKKAAKIIEENSSVNSLDALASANNVQVNAASAITLSSPTIAGAGREPKVIGKGFGLKENEVSTLIEGESGVFMIQVTKKDSAVELDNYSTFANTLKTNMRNRVNIEVFNALKEAATIEDKRAEFY
ncbi:peptidylprolyl isomerase [Ascidiimonas aurantiaca]|uniref:peptidylprolyl isomerase n=1 Tax=Ascidiimonas aurantiaca TaxID=1685432 RepID=UPI0030EB1830